MSHRAAPALLSILAVFCVVSIITIVGCDKGTPVAPSGSILAISASPTQIGLNGSSTITVIGRKPDGQPLNPGTEIRLTATNGSIPAIVLTDRDGNATATFKSNGIPGTATITAATGTGGSGSTTTTEGTSSGSGSLSASVTIQVGIPSGSKPTVAISVNPSAIPIGGKATVTIIGRNSDGSPATQQKVILTSNLGTLSNPNPTTGNDGRATTTLTAGQQSGTATVTAILGSSDPMSTTVEIRGRNLIIQANPASIVRPASGDTSTVEISLTARVTDFEGNPVSGVTVTFQTERGTIVPTGSVDTNSQGVAPATLRVTRSDLEGASTFRVTASIPSGSGEPISQTVTITVSGS